MNNKVESKLKDIINSNLAPQEKLDNITGYLEYLKERGEEVKDFKVMQSDLSNHKSYLSIAWTNNSGNIGMIGVEL